MAIEPTRPNGSTSDEVPKRPTSRLQRVRWSFFRWAKRVLLVLLAYLVCVVIGFIPVNNDFEPAEDGVTIYVASTAVHSDIIVPAKTETIDWRDHFEAKDFRAPRSPSHVAIGWGDRGFYLDTPTWSDLKASTAINAMLLPSQTVMHVQFLTPHESYVPVSITTEQYELLVDFIRGSFIADEDASFKPIGQSYSYGRFDSFYEANGRYHAFNTCNCWTGRGLKKSGVRVGWFTPLSGTVLWYLPRQAADLP